MTQAQKEKNEFRKSRPWREFRHEMEGLSLGIDALTCKPLHNGWNLHHKDLRHEHYKDLSPENFCCLNSKSHEAIHFLYPYYKKDKFILERLKKILDEMEALENDSKRL
jgi:hypothetical protein